MFSPFFDRLVAPIFRETYRERGLTLEELKNVEDAFLRGFRSAYNREITNEEIQDLVDPTRNRAAPR
jgi:hypothetical protein